MTREGIKHGAGNLAQGSRFAAPEDIKRVAMQAIENDINQYAITWGARDFREAIARKTKWYLGLEVDPETELTVTCGSTEGMIAAMMATVDPGEEVIVFEPFYENYAPDAILSDATPRYVPLRAPDWSFDEDELRSVFNSKTKAIILCNPTIRRARFSRVRKWNLSRLCKSLTRSASLTSFTTTFFTARRREMDTSRWPSSTASRAHLIVNSFQDVFSYRLARRLLHRTAEITALFESARLSDRGRAAPVQSAALTPLVPPSTTIVCIANIAHVGIAVAGFANAGFDTLSRRRVLHHDRHLEIGFAATRLRNT